MIKLPEPAAPSRWKGDPHLYSEDQLKQAIRDALEEAEKACCDVWAAARGNQAQAVGAKDCANAIRKLKEDIQ